MLASYQKAEYYTFERKQNRTKKVVFKGPPNLDTNEIINELKSKDISVLDCIPLKGNDAHTANYSQCPYLLDYLSNVRQRQQQQNKTFTSNFRGSKPYNSVAANSQPTQSQNTHTQDQNTYNQDFPALPSRDKKGMETINDFQTLIKEVEELNKLINIKELIATVRKIKESFKKNSDPLSIIASLANGP